MSLINQMLNDLEKRQAANPETNPLAGRINLTTPVQKSLPGGLALVAILVGSGLFGAFVWSQFQARGDNKAKEVPVVVAVAPAPVTTAMPANAPIPAKLATAAVTSAPRTEVTKEVPAAKPTVTATKPVAPPPVVTPPVVSTPVVSTPIATPSVSSPSVATPSIVDSPKTDKPADAVIASAAKPAAEPPTKVATTGVAPSPAASKSTAAVPIAPGAMKSVTPDQKSGNLYKQAVGMLQQFRSQEAIELLRESLRLNSGNHDARILLAGVLADNARLAEAIDTLEQGLKSSPEFVPYYRVLARTQTTAGNRTGALATLQKGNAVAGNDPDFHALYAALLQQQGSHDEAVKHYLVSLRSDPMHGAWLVGIAISLQATQRNTDAMEAYKRAIDSGVLAPDVAKFASEQLANLRQ